MTKEPSEIFAYLINHNYCPQSIIYTFVIFLFKPSEIKSFIHL